MNFIDTVIEAGNPTGSDKRQTITNNYFYDNLRVNLEPNPQNTVCTIGRKILNSPISPVVKHAHRCMGIDHNLLWQ